jgi:hypothetical protein
VKRLLKRESYDVIVSVAEPLVSHAALRCMQKFVGAAKQIAWFSDPVPSLSDVQWMRMKWRRRRCCEVAAGCLSFCEAVITVTEEIADRIRSLAGRQAPRITVVPHCFDEDDWPWPPAKQRREGEVTVVHSGALCYHRSPARLLTGVQHFQKQNGGRPAVRVQFQGAVAKNLQSEVDAWRSSGLASFEGPVDYSVSKESIRQADLLCVIDAELPKNIHLPSKIADYVGACRPILYLGRPDSPTCRCLSRIHPCFAQGHTVEETATALKELIDRRTTIPASAYWKAYKGFTARAVHRWIREFV